MGIPTLFDLSLNRVTGELGVSAVRFTQLNSGFKAFAAYDQVYTGASYVPRASRLHLSSYYCSTVPAGIDAFRTIPVGNSFIFASSHFVQGSGLAPCGSGEYRVELSKGAQAGAATLSIAGLQFRDLTYGYDNARRAGVGEILFAGRRPRNGTVSSTGTPELFSVNTWDLTRSHGWFTNSAQYVPTAELVAIGSRQAQYGGYLLSLNRLDEMWATPVRSILTPVAF
jgi:hypothetical protein